MLRSAWPLVVAAAVLAIGGPCAGALSADEVGRSTAKPARPTAASPKPAGQAGRRPADTQRPSRQPRSGGRKAGGPAAEPKAARRRFAPLAPGVEITIAPDEQEEETASTHDIVEILNGIPNLKWTPKTEPNTQTLREMATATVFRRDIWCLEFTFKPVRMMWVDVPQPSGKMQRKLIWYLLYHVTNRGQHLHPTAHGGRHVRNQARRFRRPLHSRVRARIAGIQKSYLDRLIPVAIEAIRKKEDPNRKLLNSVEISAHAQSRSRPTVWIEPCGGWPPGRTSIRESIISRSRSRG